jgi:O-antigen ligase
MNLNISLNNKYYLILSLVLAVIYALILPKYLIFFLTFIFLIILYQFKEEFILSATIILFLVLTGHEFEKVRSIVNFSLILVMTLVFLKKYGLNFQSYPRVPTQLVYFIVFLLLTLLLSSSLSIDPFSAYLSTLRSIVFFLVCYFYYSLIRNNSTIDKYLIAFFLGVVVIGASVLIDISKTGFTLFLVGGTLNRQGGIYENPNYVGLLLLITIPINIALFFRKFRYYYSFKFGLIVILLLSIILLFVSNSRSSILATLLASSITIAFINKKIFFRFISILILSLAILLLFNEVQDFLALYFRLERAGNREYFWSAGLDIILSHPYFGVGPELFDRYFFSYMPSIVNNLYESSIWSVGRPHPHNFFLLFAAENGVLGFVCAVYFFILFFYFSIKTAALVKNNSVDNYLIIVSTIGIGVGILFRAFFEVTGIITYGFITRDLPLWILFVITIHVYMKNLVQTPSNS